MNAFLSQVARHYFAEGDMGRKCFIFPNRRSIAFFRKYLSECIAHAGKPVIAPQFYTMNDLFYHIAGADQTDQINQLLVLYECYCELNPKHESLDEFIFWGGVLLSDFNDVDKYLVKADSLFTNVTEFMEMQGDFDFLDDTQREAILAFVAHFKTGGKYKDEFRKIWDILLPLYHNYNARLRAKGYSYEGQIYRKLAERLKSESVRDVMNDSFVGVDKYIFVGLNALNECEKLLLKRLRDAHMAEYCWDYSSEWVKDPHNKSSFFLSQNLIDFPQAFKTDTDGLATPKINTLSVPSSVGQAKQLPSILGELGSTGIETAVVLADESLLIPVLNSIPENIQTINVTMGYPMRASALWSFMNDIASLQLHLREKNGKWFFYYKQVFEIFSNTVFRTIAGDSGTEKAAQIRNESKYYIPQEDLAGDPFFEQIFQPVVKNTTSSDTDNIAAICVYQSDLISAVASKLKSNADMALELDFAKEYYLAIGRLRECKLPILPSTYFRLLDKLIARAAIPFRGEPLEGLQIMGPLETRALDFKNIVLLNCNEGIFPRRSVSSSFIPQELRRGFDLPTYEYQDSVWAYYFYRLIQRAENVWLLYDSRTEGVRCGEESRYIKQLGMHFGIDISRYVVKSPIVRGQEETLITKTQQDVDLIRSKSFSASSIQNYLSCPAKYYYNSVLGLKTQNEASESLDSGEFGTIFHETLQALYTVPEGKLTKEYLSSLLDGKEVKKKVSAMIIEKLHTFEVAGRNIIFEDMICRYVHKTVQRDIELLDYYGKNQMRILGLELKRHATIHGYNFYGIIDRLDTIEPGVVRVVDYKTGRVTDDDFLINEGNFATIVERLFGKDDKQRPKIALQLYLYDVMARNDDSIKEQKIKNSIYQPGRLFVRGVEEIELCQSFEDLMDARLKELIEEIVDPKQPFRRCEKGKTCDWCDYKTICGR